MRLVRDFPAAEGLHRVRAEPCVATIGNFDGVHLGHLEMLRRLRERARELKVPAVVITFEPSPREFFSPDDPPPRLTRFREKFCTLAEQSVNTLLCLRFNARMRSIEPEQFVRELLVQGLNVKYLIVGHDFRFAHRRAGTVALLKTLGDQLGFGVDEVPAYALGGERVSSSGVRAALNAGNLYRAQQLLGRPFRLSGKVLQGRQLGRTLGFPTANIALHRRRTPLTGIFAVRASGAGLDRAPAVASLGFRPVLGAATEPLLEVHVFDFDGDLYRQRLDIDFIARLRDEKWFPSLDDLTLQMHEDAAAARAALAAE